MVSNTVCWATPRNQLPPLTPSDTDPVRSDHFSLSSFYDDYPRIEEAFDELLDVSLEPRSPDLLYGLVAAMRLQPAHRSWTSVVEKVAIP